MHVVAPVPPEQLIEAEKLHTFLYFHEVTWFPTNSLSRCCLQELRDKFQLHRQPQLRATKCFRRTWVLIPPKHVTAGECLLFIKVYIVFWCLLTVDVYCVTTAFAYNYLYLLYNVFASAFTCVILVCLAVCLFISSIVIQTLIILHCVSHHQISTLIKHVHNVHITPY